MRQPCFTFCLLVFALLLAPASEAARFRYLPVDELAERSDACVLARVVDEQVGWNSAGTIIVTTFTLELEETLAGDLSGGLMTLTRVGGEIDGLALGHPGMPQLAMGDRAVVFVLDRGTESFIVSGLHQGVLHARAGSFERKLDDVSGAPARIERLSLAELRRELSRGLERKERRLRSLP